MKTLKDLEEMKNKPMTPFANQYNYFFMDIENNYIKSNINRIKHSLKDWDTEARKFIINELIKILLSGGMSLDSEELLEINELIEA